MEWICLKGMFTSTRRCPAHTSNLFHHPCRSWVTLALASVKPHGSLQTDQTVIPKKFAFILGQGMYRGWSGQETCMV